jgi:hypothetical protein
MLQGTPLGGLHEITASERSAAMHQRGHDYYGTACPDRCVKAGSWAARRLITPRTMLRAARSERCFDDLAAALHVLPADVGNYLSDLDPDEWLIMRSLVGRDLTRPE